MLKYIINDLLAALRYLPYGIIAGLFAVVILYNFNRGRIKRGRDVVSLPAVSCLVMYVAVLLAITYFSRESGSRSGMMDLELFSTWCINNRNNAYMVALCWPGLIPGREIFSGISLPARSPAWPLKVCS